VAATGPSVRLQVLRDTSNVEERTNWAPYGAGGVWRRRQIDQILRRHGLEPLNMEPPPRASIPQKLRSAAAAKIRCGRGMLWTRVALASAAYSYAFYQHNAARSGVARVVLLEWGTDPVAFAALKDAGVKIVVTLMAVGSLWRERPSTISGAYPGMFLTEIDSLRLADAVFCISREEQWLLSNLGIAAGYLPYFPDEERERALADERAARPARGGGSEFLICATRGNTDTVDSFREQATWIRESVPEGAAVFHVTGNQTESVRDIWSDPRFVFHGTCPEDEFVALKARCRAICLHSQKGLGAVTRVPDMLLAGLSVIANGPAARSFLDAGGVHVYDTRDEFGALLQTELPPPPTPRRPVALEEAFSDRVKSLV
jgi:hypothetical protein